MYPDRHHRVIEEVRFHLGQYLGEIERAYSVEKSTGPLAFGLCSEGG